MSATRMMNNGQIAYVEPQTCCERNAPWTVPIKMNGSTNATFVRCGMLNTANTKETTNRKGHKASNRSARSDESASMIR